VNPDVLIPLPIAVPLLGAGVSLLLRRHLALQRALGVLVLGVSLAASVALLILVDQDGVSSTDLGGWAAPVGITLVADLTSTILLLTASVVLFVVLLYSIGTPRVGDTLMFFHPIYLVLAAGVGAAFLTGDLFNLFVAFEVMLISSYVLLTLGGSERQVRSGMTYVVVSLVASVLFVTAVGLVYAATGTVNMADLAGRVAELPSGVRTGLALLFLAVFGIKAAIFPLFFWLPDSYPSAPAPVTALFAGLLTKIGVYAIIRTQTLIFPGDTPETLLLVVAGLTMVVGVLGAIAQADVKRILSFHIVSQIGYMIMGLAFFTVAGLAGALLFIVHNMVIKTTLLLVSGSIEVSAGTSALKRLSGIAHRAPLLAGLFLLSALSLAGLPPLSGFVAKLALIEAGVAARSWAIVGVSLLVSVCTLFSMLKIWTGAFWGEPEIPSPHPEVATLAAGGVPRLMGAATLILATVGVALALFAGPLYDLAERGAVTLVEPTAYVQEVLGP
jgi:multicomponent Na+:H+ antiporter subunit D